MMNVVTAIDPLVLYLAGGVRAFAAALHVS
jgi:hypothetical protein